MEDINAARDIRLMEREEHADVQEPIGNNKVGLIQILQEPRDKTNLIDIERLQRIKSH